jgi:hypothetical protein
MVAARRARPAASLSAAPSPLADHAAATPPHCPPGRAKKAGRAPSGAWRLPSGGLAGDRDRWRVHGLRRPGRGERRAVVDRDASLILDATRAIIEAPGAVERAAR